MYITSEDKQTTRLSDNRTMVIYRLGYGLIALRTSAKKRVIFAMFLIFAIVLWKKRRTLCWLTPTTPDHINTLFSTVYTYAILILICGFLLYLFSSPFKAASIARAFQRIGFYNHVGITPPLITSREKNGVMIYMFHSIGISIDEWQEKQLQIENALNITIDSINLIHKRQDLVEVTAYFGTYNYSNSIAWQSGYLTENPHNIVLGECISGQVIASLSDDPHWLIGGITGSGKSILLMLILMQCIRHKHNVYIIDFKGGVDFDSTWEDHSVFITTMDDLLATLDSIICELTRRKTLLRGYHNTINYYKQTGEYLAPIILAIDELAEIMDKTGASKENKEKIAKVEDSLSRILRTGRFADIHVIAAMQRPDANVLPGQLKTNFSLRICGKSDSILSQIILDSSDAADRIPFNTQGVFLTNAGKLFKGYLFHENDLPND